jgi:hypothetical protein
MALHKLKNGTEIDLAEEGLVPHTAIAAERGAKTKAENELVAAIKQFETAQKQQSLLAARLHLSSGAPDERTARQLMAAYNADIEGNNEPPAFDAWLNGDGAKLAAAVRPSVEAPKAADPAKQADPAKAAEPAKPADPAKPATPNTSTSTVQAATPGGMTAQQYQQATAPLLAAYQRVRTPEEKAVLRKEMDDLDAKFSAGAPAQV